MKPQHSLQAFCLWWNVHWNPFHSPQAMSSQTRWQAFSLEIHTQKEKMYVLCKRKVLQKGSQKQKRRRRSRPRETRRNAEIHYSTMPWWLAGTPATLTTAKQIAAQPGLHLPTGYLLTTPSSDRPQRAWARETNKRRNTVCAYTPAVRLSIRILYIILSLPPVRVYVALLSGENLSTSKTDSPWQVSSRVQYQPVLRAFSLPPTNEL